MKSWCHLFFFFFFKKKTAYEMRISDWSSDVCSSDLGSAEMDGAFFMPRLRRRRKERGMSVAGIRRESPSAAPALSGVWLPLVTPFLEGAVDHESATRLTRRSVEAGVAGLLPAATPGEGLPHDAHDVAGLIVPSANTADVAGPGPLGASGA